VLRVPSAPENTHIGWTEPLVTVQLTDGLVPCRLKVAGIGPGRSEDETPRLQDFKSHPVTG
jgi:hypothetical protein